MRNGVIRVGVDGYSSDSSMRTSGWRHYLLKGDLLEAIDRLVPWESFRADIEAVVLTPDEPSAGSKLLDAIEMFRMLILQALNDLSDEQVEYQVRDRMLFTRFLWMVIENSIPDQPVWSLLREKLAKAGLIEKLFERSTSKSPPKAVAVAVVPLT